MDQSPNGWEAWYAFWDEDHALQDGEAAFDVISYQDLAHWGETFCENIMLNDHWTGYTHSRPMSLEDGMSIAFVLYDAGVNVDELLDVLDSFQPFEDAPIELGIPLCWLTEPMDHVQDLLSMLSNISNLDPEVLAETQHALEETLGEAPLDAEELPALFQAMVTSTAQWLLEITRILGDNGTVALRAWWQGRLITLLREATTPSRRRDRRRRQPGQAEMPSAFRDLIQSLDFRGLGPDSEDADAPEPQDDSGRY